MKMAKLVDVYRPSKTLSRRQLPLVIDETLTMVMDLKSVGLVSDNQQIKGKELEDFSRKMSLLTEDELGSSLEVSRSEILKVLNQAVPCVGCRRSVERLYYQLFKYGHPTLDPLVIKKDGIITVREDKQNSSQFLCNLFHGHSTRLNHVVDSQPRRSKKSHRCLLHSLDSQRSRPITPAWRDVWECMRPECKRDNVFNVIFVSSSAYSLLIEDPEPCKEKGYVSTLYAGIKRCIPDKHIHLQTKTEYIAKLISRAEPELLGSRRERHAKTLEIAQEEVLTCIGICMYERLHRIYMRMREEECTCQVFAAVAIDALWRSFETAVERKQGVSQLELLYAELTREEQQKQLRKEQKKLKRKRKKERMAEQDGKETYNDCEDGDEFDEKEDVEKECSCTPENKVNKMNEVLNCPECMELSPTKNKCINSKGESLHEKNHHHQNAGEKKGGGDCSELWVNDCKCGGGTNVKSGKKNYKCDNNYLPAGEFKKENGSSSDHSHDCGYSSENNNGCCEITSLSSSLPSSPEGSEVACPDGCCQPEPDYIPYNRFSHGNGHQLSLQEMLDDHFYSDDDSECYITPEEVQEFKTNNRKVCEMRQQLRETLQKKFAQLCVNGPLQVPRILVPTKFASN
ncbi:gametogenetin-binding protein 2 [Holotrichia oblita]|uniref:Gametogenetin-binding protein 2 n=1 Tax=Holotrichia oblita TaxID=644536 RepID=A0ACB9T2L4_HOLOL|nr:gametogenetin-binding protein 2 [Holotrichia oblita]